jgi:hypothetical protein
VPYGPPSFPSANRVPVPVAPRPPAFDTAVASAALAKVPIPALQIGYFKPNAFMNDVAGGVGMALNLRFQILDVRLLAG